MDRLASTAALLDSHPAHGHLPTYPDWCTAAAVHASNAVPSLRVSNEWDFVGLRTYVIAHAKKAGIAGSQADLARATGIDETKLSRWFRGVARPSTASLQQLAASVPGLQVDTLMALTGHAGPANAPALPGLPEPSHPVARDLDQLLSPGSPLSEADQDALAAVVSRIVDSFKPPRRRTA